MDSLRLQAASNGKRDNATADGAVVVEQNVSGHFLATADGE